MKESSCLARLLATGNDPYFRLQLAGGNDDHQIARIVAGHRKDAFGIFQIGCVQLIVVAGITLQVKESGIFFLVILKAGEIFVNCHKVPVGRGQLMRHVAPDPPKSADDVMTFEFSDCFFHAFSPQGSIEVGFEQGNGDDRKEQRQIARPENADDDSENPRRLVARHVDDFTEANRRHCNKRHVKTVKPRIFPLGQHHVTDGAEQMDGKQHAHRNIDQLDV